MVYLGWEKAQLQETPNHQIRVHAVEVTPDGHQRPHPQKDHVSQGPQENQNAKKAQKGAKKGRIRHEPVRHQLDQQTAPGDQTLRQGETCFKGQEEVHGVEEVQDHWGQG